MTTSVTILPSVVFRLKEGDRTSHYGTSLMQEFRDMVRTFVLRSLCVLALGAVTVAPARAEMTPLQEVDLSMQLFQRGVDQANPLLILAAAGIRKGTTFAPAGEGAGASAPLDWTEMLAAARDLAADDPALLAMVEDLEADTAKGVTTGQIYSVSEIDDGGENIYDALPFDAGQYAEVYVESNDGSDLNLYVYDAAGRLVCSDTDVSSISYCGWRPSEAGEFTIKVENKGQGDAGYSLMTN
jgi:hypothetical protein